MSYAFAPLAEEHRLPVVDIFNHYIANSFAAYLEEPVGYEFYDMLLAAARAGYPALAALAPAGQVAGFGLLRPWHPLTSFRRTAEISYFLAPSHTRQGLGGTLLDLLHAGGRAMGVDNLLASISSLNQPSLDFHAGHGFVECGRFVRVGRKLGRDFDVVWMQKFI